MFSLTLLFEYLVWCLKNIFKNKSKPFLSEYISLRKILRNKENPRNNKKQPEYGYFKKRSLTAKRTTYTKPLNPNCSLFGPELN